MAKAWGNKVKDRLIEDLDRAGTRQETPEERDERVRAEEEWNRTSDPEDVYYAHQRKAVTQRRRDSSTIYGEAPGAKKKGKGKGKGKKNKAGDK